MWNQLLHEILVSLLAVSFVQAILGPRVHIDLDTPQTLQLTGTESVAALDVSEHVQATRKEFIRQLIEEGGFGKVGRAWVTPGFMALDSDTKENFLSCRSERPAVAATSVLDCFWTSPS